ncbi:zf-HC2 domain-containing protein [Paenibacillus lignilyticus]|uniref:Anti-sigma-W factor RsiW n=1 Tax=Paenibacillus lignilyticus TaxID=1172615 RepID=A0ABS5CK16_9BACL|nr:zf-HC2 domain-containing protein [Paenibacillus lignilyticus]MBP3966161.1 zf-HC2 domain-containing protein [Paenibacillus lignilyticus]
MNCQEVMEYMQRQLDGDLDEQEAEFLMTHTRHCPECAAMLERLELLSSGLSNLPKVTPSYSLVDAILPRLAELQVAQDTVQGNTSMQDREMNPSAMARRIAPSSEKRRWTDRFSIRAIGGIIAAGIIAGLFIVNYDPSRSMNDSAQDMAADSSNTYDTAQNTSTADASTSANQSEKATNDSVAADEITTETAAPLASMSDEKPMMKSEIRNVDPNGETMPPLTAETDGGAPAVKGQSPNYEVSRSSDANSDSGDTAAATDSGAEDQAANSKSDNANTTADKDRTGFTTENVIMASPISPDGMYQAFIVEDTVRIYTVQDSLMIFQGVKRTGIANLKWSEDSLVLTYEGADADGSKHVYSVDAKKATEQQVQSIK